MGTAAGGFTDCRGSQLRLGIFGDGGTDAGKLPGGAERETASGGDATRISDTKEGEGDIADGATVSWDQPNSRSGSM